MKAIIVEIYQDYVAAMRTDGEIIRLKNQNYEVGEVVIVKKEQKKKIRFIAWVATAATFVMLAGVGVWSFFTPYTYVSLDVNPSIEFEANWWGVVITANAVNADGAEILEGIDLKYSKLENAVVQTVQILDDEGYFEGQEESGMILAFACENQQEAEELQVKLQTQIQEMMQEEYGEGQVDVEAISVGLERVEEAKELGVTPGKLNLVEKLIESSDQPETIDKMVWLNMSVKDIMKATKDNKKADKEIQMIEDGKTNNGNNDNKKDNDTKIDKKDKDKDEVADELDDNEDPEE